MGVALVAGVAAATRAESAPFPLIAEFTLVLALAAIGLWASERVVEADPSNVDPRLRGDRRTFRPGHLISGRLALSAWTTPPHGVGIGPKIAAILASGLLNWKYLLAGFILFRVFDIWKPFPARRAEFLPGGLGIMADDWIAGAYAALGLWLIRALGF